VTEAEIKKWLDEDAAVWRELCGGDLLGGYASLQEPPRFPQGEMP